MFTVKKLVVLSQILVLGIVLIAKPEEASARTRCEITPQGTLCTTEVDFARFYDAAYQSQYQSQWCWAASISMVFAHAGFGVQQDRIVTETYGSPVNMPAIAGYVMAQQLSRNWVDDSGREFSARVTGVYDYDYGLYGLSNDQIVSDLDSGKPLVIGARSHAMVLTSVTYYDTVYGPNIVAAGVFDPWPGIGPRALAQDELTAVEFGGSLRFLAAVEVDAINTSTGNDNRTIDPYGGGSAHPLMFLLLALLLVVRVRRKMLGSR